MTGIDFPFDDRVPEPGGTTEVAPGVHWLRMPLPFDLDHINLWLLDDGDGWAIVDTGLGTDETQVLWRSLLGARGAGPNGEKPLKRVLATHFHPDHMGQAGWLCEEFGVELWTTRTEWMMARSLYLDTEGANRHEMAEFYRANGVPDEWYDGSVKMGNTYRAVLVEPPPRFRRVIDGERLDIGGREWRVMVGDGHAPEHAAFYSAELDLLISGDHILPRISPHIGLWASEPEANPLNDYLTSLDGFRTLPAETLVLPSHVQPFRGLHQRIQDIQDHHEDRLGKLAAAFNGAALTGYEAIPAMWDREFEGFQLGLAMGECLAHLVYLVHRGDLAAEQGADGITRFRRSGA